MGGNKFWRMANFTVLYNFRFRSGGLFKDYDLHKVAQPSTSMEEINAVNLNYLFCLFIKFVTEVVEKSRERFSLRLTEAKTGNTLRIPRGGGTPRNSCWGYAARVFKSRPYCRPKHAIFLTRFQT